MPTIYAHEMAAYRLELQSIESQFIEVSHGGSTNNLTHAVFATSNRVNLFVVGLCSLVEAWLYQMTESYNGAFQLSDIRGQGISKLKLFLSRTGTIDFSRLKYWESFQKACDVRNAIIHSYGGMALEEGTDELIRALTALKIQSALVGGRRIRLGPKALQILLDIIDGLLNELGAYAT
jgi:hypothetical protein